MTTPRTLPPNIFQINTEPFVQLSRSFNLPNTLIIRCHVSTRATKEASCFWGCGQIFTLIIKRILGIKRIFPCNFGNKRMRLLTRVYGTLSGCVLLNNGSDEESRVASDERQSAPTIHSRVFEGGTLCSK